ncbi:hypothetical protein [Paenibacillus pini]|uniref:Uncharacterized protein n=1 Tax=Paenibacillus pini JCM 16418 TaxID=1236976 RepID=W7YQG8_9BACL|nr:hypothetical protein [Paenibacillus pini]GAF10792.1 hypothetical protein JCM16418_5013 [Paenibacillus pini JCM 16418]
MTFLRFTLSDDTTHTFADFQNAIRFCEDEFGYEGKGWDSIKSTNYHFALRDFLVDDGISVEIFT